MITPGAIFTDVLVRPILTLLVAIYQGLFALHVPYALGFSIIILTILIRFLLYPFIASQLKASKKMQALTPHLSRLKEKHKGDTQRLQQETMRLYKEHGVNPAAGCLPMFIQLPVIWALYSVLQNIVQHSPEKVISYVNQSVYVSSLRLTHPWDQHFFGIPIGQNPSTLLRDVGPLVLLVPVLTGVFQLIQSKMMLSQAAQQADVQKLKLTKEKEKKEDDFASAFQTQSLYIFPFMIGFFSFSFPIGLSLYWNTFTIFGILQQYRIQGLGGLKDWIEVLGQLWKRKNKK